MIKNYLAVTLRNIKRHKGYSAINLAGLIIGMAGYSILMLWVITELKFDCFHDNLDRLAVVTLETESATGRQVFAATQAPMAPLLMENIPGIENYIRSVTRWHTLSCKGISRGEPIMFADSSILTALSFPMLMGDPSSALTSPNSVVLTESAAAKYFGDNDPMGETITLNNAVGLTVTGVIEEAPLNSSIQFKILVPFNLLKDVDEDPEKWAGLDYFTLLLLSPETSESEMSGRVGDFCHNFYFGQDRSEENHSQYKTVPFSGFHLHGKDGDGGRINTLIIISIVALCLLIVSTVNFVLLTTARISHRSREVGIRKVLGASPGQIARQVIVETTSISALAMLIVVLVLSMTLSLFNELAHTNFTITSFILELGVLMLIWIIVTGLLAGIFPAVSMAKMKSISIVRGRLVSGRTGRKFRHILVIIQVSISVVFLLLATLMYQQLHYILTKDLGMNKENIVCVPAPADIQESYDSFKLRLLSQPGILAVTSSEQSITNINSNTDACDFDGRDPGTKIRMHFDRIGYDYDKVFGLQMAQGRFYSEDDVADAKRGIVLNEKAIRVMGIENPIGQRFSFWGRDKTIIGVVKDFHLAPLNKTIKPLILILEPSIQNVFIKISPTNQSETIGAIEGAFHEVSPGSSFTYAFLNTHFLGAQEIFLGILSMVSFASVLVAFIASLGLLGLASFMAESRRHEIGVRKALGATTYGIMRLFLLDFMKLAALALAIGCPAGYIFGSDWLSDLPYHTEIGWGLFAITGMLTITVVLLAIGLQVIRAARANPVDALRHD